MTSISNFVSFSLSIDFPASLIAYIYLLPYYIIFSRKKWSQQMFYVIFPEFWKLSRKSWQFWIFLEMLTISKCLEIVNFFEKFWATISKVGGKLWHWEGYMSSKCLKMKSTLTQGSDLFSLCRDQVKLGKGVYIENETFPGT